MQLPLSSRIPCVSAVPFGIHTHQTTRLMQLPLIAYSIHTHRTPSVMHFPPWNCIACAPFIAYKSDNMRGHRSCFFGCLPHPTTREMQFHLGNRMTRVSLIALPAAHMHNRQSTKYTLHGICAKYFESGSAMRTSTQGFLRFSGSSRNYLGVSRNAQAHQESFRII